MTERVLRSRSRGGAWWRDREDGFAEPQRPASTQDTGSVTASWAASRTDTLSTRSCFAPSRVSPSSVLELFDDPVTFEAYWRSLVDGYALDAALSTDEDTATPEQAAAFLDATRRIPFESRPGVSLGDDVLAETDDLVATGIGWGGELLHLVCFARA